MSLTVEQVKEILLEAGALLKNDHFLLSSGRHADQYVNKDALYPKEGYVETLCQAIAKHFAVFKIEAVIGAACGGIILSHEVKKAFNQFNLTSDTVSVYAEKSGDEFVIKRGFDKLVADKKVLVVEDILTTGASAAKVARAVEKCGGTVIGVGALVNRGKVTAEVLRVPQLFSLLELTLPTYEPDQCPMCQQGIPINRQIGQGSKLPK